MSYEVLQSSAAEFKKKRDQCEVPFSSLIMTHSPCNEIWWCCIFRLVRSETVRTWTLCVTNSPPPLSAPITRETPLYQCVASMRSVFCEFLFKCKEFNIQVKSQEAFLTGFKIIALIFFLNKSCSLHVYEITIKLALTILFSCNLIKYRGIAELNTHLK